MHPIELAAADGHRYLAQRVANRDDAAAIACDFVDSELLDLLFDI